VRIPRNAGARQGRARPIQVGRDSGRATVQLGAGDRRRHRVQVRGEVPDEDAPREQLAIQDRHRRPAAGGMRKQRARAERGARCSRRQQLKPPPLSPRLFILGLCHVRTRYSVGCTNCTLHAANSEKERRIHLNADTRQRCGVRDRRARGRAAAAQRGCGSASG
jgi:hypothetical protein